MKVTRLFCTASMIAVWCAASGPALAQAAPAEDVADETEIVVTAQRQNETLQSVSHRRFSVQCRSAGKAADQEFQRPDADPAQHHVHQDRVHQFQLHHPRGG
ncbi:hypothetical protein [Novosphingobium sp. B 225]|uniref:hypothetical protein n=1 Tax=Novosphingobium sp. B 225 TaxID=1961849 RepID=UPI0020CD2BC4|nr:hypothetical protein [Novosphingobium sp. B 225]